MKNKDKLAIFDFDGTLFDTRKVNYLAYNDALNEHNFSIEYDYYCDYCDGLDYKSFLPKIIGLENNLLETIHIRKKEIYKKYIAKAKMNIHLFNIADLIKPEYWLAIVTTASRKNCLDLLCNFNRENYFDKILAQEDILRKKPDPQGFLMAMEYFSVGPENTIIFEDSSAGLEAAKKAGVAVFKIESF
jgi:beta-phosphoglucomutase